MDPNVSGASVEKQVRHLLEDLTLLFETHRVTAWPEKLRHWALRIDQGDYANVVREIRAEWGGMGGISGVAILRANGHLVDNEAAAAQRLDKFLSKLWNAMK